MNWRWTRGGCRNHRRGSTWRQSAWQSRIRGGSRHRTAAREGCRFGRRERGDPCWATSRRAKATPRGLCTLAGQLLGVSVRDPGSFAHRRKPFRAIQAGVGERRRKSRAGGSETCFELVLGSGAGKLGRSQCSLCVYRIAGQEQAVEWWTATKRRRAFLRCPRKSLVDAERSKVAAASARPQPTAGVLFPSTGTRKLPAYEVSSLGLVSAPTRCSRVLLDSPPPPADLHQCLSSFRKLPPHATRCISWRSHSPRSATHGRLQSAAGAATKP